MTVQYTILPESNRPPPPQSFSSAGPVALYRAVGVLGRPYAPMPKDIRSDEVILGMVTNAVGNLREAHGTVPPDDVLVAIHRMAWDHYRSPRRKKYNPQADAQRWALAEVIRAARVWATKRPDAFGTHVQYAHLVDLVNRVVYGGSEPVATVEHVEPVVVAPEPAPEPATAAEPEKKLHWKVRQKMEREAAAKAPPLLAPPAAAAPVVDPFEKARRRAEAILAAGRS
jgi:hypothetical protein